MNNLLSLQLRMPNGNINCIKLIGKYNNFKDHGIDSSIIYSVWFEDDETPGGYFSFSPKNQAWEYYGYLSVNEQMQIAEFLEEQEVQAA
ncbi:MAG: hypothetical protein JST50_18130 [Bacteroidetes bacterium]|jgi:hypothetical protein|nr:hypothetical protein [Bacteroidota bacterium]